MQVVLTEAAYGREGERLRGIAPEAEFVRVVGENRFTLDGEPVAPEALKADVVWLSGDSWRAGLLETLVAVIEAGRPRWVQAHSAGLDLPMFKAMISKGARVTKNAAQAVAMAEYVMAHALSLLVPVDAQRHAQAERRWEWTPFKEVNRTHWGVVGWGEIGQEIATRVLPFGAKVSAFRRSAGPDSLVGATHALAELPAVLPDLDVVVLALPANGATRKMCDAAFFAAMAPGSIFINVARGALVDDAALREALDAGRPAHAVLDVFETEPLPTDSWIWGHPRVRMSAHTSWNGDGNAQRSDDRFVENFRRFVAGERMLNEAEPREAGL